MVDFIVRKFQIETLSLQYYGFVFQLKSYETVSVVSCLLGSGRPCRDPLHPARETERERGGGRERESEREREGERERDRAL